MHAERLAQTSGEAVRVGVLHGPSVVIVHHVFRPDAVFQVLEVGAQLPAHASALGKAMLAWADPGVVAELTAEPLTRLTNRTVGAGGLRSALDEVREKGFARERDEAVLGESSVAAPIFDHGGHAVGAIGVAGDTQRVLPRGPARGLAAAVVEAARAVSRELGAGRWPGGPAPG